MLKRARHEKEKEYMENLRVFGNPVGEYAYIRANPWKPSTVLVVILPRVVT